MAVKSSLIAITMLARSGATALAWQRFEAGGFATDDPAALAVRGRLLKDRARAAVGAEARALFAESAAAYARAAAIDGTTYPLINAATLTLLGGDAEGAARLAGQVLERLANGAPDRETPYYRGATHAEALLLLGRRAEAEAALVAAIALAPAASEDHATTLRQFALIHRETGADDAWLNAYRAARTLHFTGRMASPLAPAAQAALAGDITGILATARIGTAYGALAAGADLVIAEALVANGVALHVVLPTNISAFLDVSVVPAGAAWRSRFETILAAAASIDTGTALGVDAPAIALAGERAMGRAIQTADRLATSAHQLIITGPAGAAGINTGRDAALWHATGRPQHVLHWPEPIAASSVAAPAGDRLTALIEVGLDADAGLDGLSDIAAALAALPAPLAIAATPAGARLAWTDPAVAAHAAMAILAAIHPTRAPHIAGHYAVTPAAPDPFTGKLALFGDEVARTARLAALVPPGALYASEDFLAGLVLRSPDFRHEYVGDAPGERNGADLPLHAIGRRGALPG